MDHEATLLLQSDAESQVWTFDWYGKVVRVDDVRSIDLRSRIACRIVGTSDNYGLIVRLWNRLRSENTTFAVHIGERGILTEGSTVEDSLYRLSSLYVHHNLPSMWHRLDDMTYATYLLLSLRQRGVDQSIVDLAWNNHPVRRWLLSKGVVDKSVGQSLIADIVDPRWFVNVSRASDMSRLELYFGLRPHHFIAACQPEATTTAGRRGARFARTRNLIAVVDAVNRSCDVSTGGSRIVPLESRYQDCRRFLRSMTMSWRTSLLSKAKMNIDWSTFDV